jgi:hypothetical protein
MWRSRLPIDEMIKSAASLTSAISLLGFQHLSRILSSNQITPFDHTKAAAVHGIPISDRFIPRRVIREIMGLAWHSAEMAQKITSGVDTLFLEEFQNKLKAFSLFEHVDYALSLGPSSSLSLSQLVARVATLDPSISVWATEGVGHYFADRYPANHNEPHALMSCPDSLGVPQSSLVPLNAGLGLALAEWLLDTANSERRIDSSVIATFVGLCRNNCSPGCEEVGFEALGLAARSLHPHLISPIDALLSSDYPDLLDYFWHGVGRALYFSPTQFLPLCSKPWQGLDMSLQEPLHAAGRRNAVAGFVWALTLVNIRNPEIVAEFLDRNAAHLPEPQTFVNGLCSALIVWSDAQPGQRLVGDFVDYRAGSPDCQLSRLWTTYVQRPWARTLRDHSWDERNMGSLFRYQSLVGAIDLDS